MRPDSKKALRTTSTRAVCFLLCLVTPLLAHAQGFKRQNLPVAIDVEKTSLRSPLYLQLELKSYGRPFENFMAGKLDENEAAFAAAVQAIHVKDYAKFHDVWETPAKLGASAKSGSGVSVADSSNTWLDGYKGIFDFDHVSVIAQALIGSHSVFIWEANAKVGPVRRAFIVQSRDKQLKVSAVTSDTQVEEILLNSMEAARKNPDAYKPIADIHLKYQYAVPIEGKGNSGNHPVFLEFDGTAFDFDLAQADAHAPGPVAEFYRKAYQAYTKNDIDDFTRMFTPKSAEALRSWMYEEKKKSPETRDLRLLDQRYMKFVLNADPVFLVFLSAEKGTTWNPASLVYRCVVKDPASGNFALANLAYGNALDQLLQDSNLFDKRILKTSQTQKARRK